MEKKYYIKNKKLLAHCGTLECHQLQDLKVLVQTYIKTKNKSARTPYTEAITIAPIFRQLPLLSCEVNKHWNVDMEQFLGYIPMKLAPTPQQPLPHKLIMGTF